MSTKKKITVENSIGYGDRIFITPLTLTELADMELVTPDPTEEIEIETCDCGTGSPTDPIGPGGNVFIKQKIDLHVDVRPDYPTPQLKVHPKSYTIYPPAPFSIVDYAKLVQGEI